MGGDNIDGIFKWLNFIPDTVKLDFIMIGITDLGKGSSVPYIYLNYFKILIRLKKGSILPNYAIDNNITFIDLNYYLSKNKHLCSKYSEDGIHLNKNGYTKWMRVLKVYLNYIFY